MRRLVRVGVLDGGGSLGFVCTKREVKSGFLVLNTAG